MTELPAASGGLIAHEFALGWDPRTNWVDSINIAGTSTFVNGSLMQIDGDYEMWHLIGIGERPDTGRRSWMMVHTLHVGVAHWEWCDPAITDRQELMHRLIGWHEQITETPTNKKEK